MKKIIYAALVSGLFMAANSSYAAYNYTQVSGYVNHNYQVSGYHIEHV